MDINTEKNIKDAFDNPNYEWRTVKGVAVEAKVSQEDVRRYIAMHGDEVVKASARNENGEILYASREVYRKKASMGARISSIFRNRGA